MIDILRLMKSQLAEVPGVSSIEIGLEVDVNPDDFPALRLVPGSLSHVDGDFQRKTMELEIHYANNLFEFESGKLEGIYENQLNTADHVIRIIEGPNGGKYTGVWDVTELDRDAIAGKSFPFKVARMVFSISAYC